MISLQITSNDIAAATEGMTQEEAKAFEEKMLKMTEVLETELNELEEQKTKLNVRIS